MIPHPPKVFAIEALVANQLSQRGRARLDRHLAKCEMCSAALSAAREYQRLRETARELPMPELSWERLERALDQNVAPHSQPVQAGRNGKLVALVPLLAIAATFVIGWVGISGQREAARLAARTQTPAAQEQSKPADEPAIQGWVTLGAQASHAPGSTVSEGETLRTGPEEELHVHLAANTGILLAPDSELIVTQLRAHRVRLTLVQGGVSNVVR